MAAMVTPPSKTQITHAIFDLDGVLLDTEIFYTLVQEKILARFGKTFDWSLKTKMMDKNAIESARIFLEESGIGDEMTPEGFLVESEAMLQDLFPTCELMPGVKRLISYLHANGIPMAVATGSHKRHFDLKTQKHGDIISIMHHVVMGDDPEVKNGTPSPDLFLTDARSFEGNVDPRNILVFEDAPAGVGATKNAGISHKRHFDLKTQKHDDIISCMHHVVMGDDPEVKNGKPYPDVVLAAGRRFEGNVDPRNILVFEDASAGVVAAKNTGISHKRHFDLKTQKHGDIISGMHHVVIGDDLEVKNRKPYPDVVLAAGRRFEGNVDPRNILVFEDASAGVVAAKNVGISHKRHFDLKTQKHGDIISGMHDVVMGDDPEVKNGKPSPDVFLDAARRFEGNVDPRNILVFADSPAGVAAAKNAGMYVVMVPDPKLDASYHKDADEVLTSLLNFNPSIWGLPPFHDVMN